MSPSDSSEHVQPTPPQEGEEIAYNRVALGGAAALVIFGLAVLVMFLLLRDWELPPAAVAPVPPQVGQEHLNFVRQRMLVLQDEARREQAEERRRLDSYGWVDRQRGLIHIPVERAMDELLSQPRGGGRP